MEEGRPQRGYHIAVSVLLVTALIYVTQLSTPALAPVVRFFYLIPVAQAAVTFGLGMSMAVALLGALMFVPLLATELGVDPYGATTIEVAATMLLLPVLAYLLGSGWGRLNRQRRLYHILYQITNFGEERASERETLEQLLYRACVLLGARSGEVLLDEGHGLVQVAQFGAVQPLREQGPSLARWVLEGRKPLLINNIDEQPIYEALNGQQLPHSALAVPLAISGALSGLLTFYDAPNGFRREELGLAQMIGSKIEAMVEAERALRQRAERDRLQSELELAREVQQRFLPRSAPEIPGYEVAGRSLPAREVGGDFFVYLQLEDGRWHISVGDISGKGVTGAFYMAIATTLVEIRARECEPGRSVLPLLNALFYSRLAAQGVNAALAYAVLTPDDGAVWTGNAGLIAPLLWRAADATCAYLDVSGLPLGAYRDARYEELGLTLAPGDVLVLVSDGVVEAQNRSRELYGLDRLELLVCERAASDAPQQLCEAIIAAATSFSGDADPHDDLTVVVIRRSRIRSE